MWFSILPLLLQRGKNETNKWNVKGQTNERADKWTHRRTNKQTVTNKWTNERMKKRTNKRTDEQTNGRTHDARTNGRTEEGTNAQKNGRCQNTAFEFDSKCNSAKGSCGSNRIRMRRIRLRYPALLFSITLASPASGILIHLLFVAVPHGSSVKGWAERESLRQVRQQPPSTSTQSRQARTAQWNYHHQQSWKNSDRIAHSSKNLTNPRHWSRDNK